MEKQMSDPLVPSAALLCKLGSILVHSEEAGSSWGHEFDVIALQGLINDPQVVEWMQQMQDQGFLPEKRR